MLAVRGNPRDPLCTAGLFETLELCACTGLEVGRPTSISVEGHFQKVFFVGFEPATSSFLC